MTEDERRAYFHGVVQAQHRVQEQAYLDALFGAHGDTNPPIFVGVVAAALWAHWPEGAQLGDQVIAPMEVALAGELVHGELPLADVLRVVGEAMIARANELDAGTPHDA